MRVDQVRLTIELTPEQAAGLKRFTDKVSHESARSVLYPHVRAEIRNDQASTIIAALDRIDRALRDADVSSWPWIETGQV